MIRRFEEQTEDLNFYEIQLREQIVLGLKNKIGMGCAITGVVICEKMKDLGYKINQARLRKIINSIRSRRIIENLVACKNGYYIADNPEDVREYVKSLVERYTSIRGIAESYGLDMDSLFDEEIKDGGS
jgi:hypothetical protein